MTIEELSTVCFVGAGTMGCSNSLVAAVSGYEVVLHDAMEPTLAGVAARHSEIGGFLVEVGYCSADALEAGLTRVRLAADLAEATAAADLVSESVFEDVDIKRDLHRRLDEICPDHTILTTNTSALLVSDIEDVVDRGDRFAALHSHLGSLLFDIVGGPRTSPATIETLRRYVTSLSGVPLVLRKEHRGYLFNALNGPILATAVQLVLNDSGSIQDVDRTWMLDRSAPMGPFAQIDLFGIDLVLDSWRRPSDDPARRALQTRVVRFLSGYVDSGRLGQKSGEGFYTYPSPAYRAPGFVDASSSSPGISRALLVALVCAAVALAADDVASRDDIDLAWTAATSLGIGPFGIVEEMGTDAVVAMLADQVADGLLAADVAERTQRFLTRSE